VISLEKAREILNKQGVKNDISDEQLQNIIIFLYSLCSKVVQNSLPNLVNDNE
jgi:hypothetical protein